MADHNAAVTVFILRVGLGSIPASYDDVLGEIGSRLDTYEPLLSVENAGLVLSLRVVARDLWLAVLLAMAAVTNLGYAVVRLDARPAEPAIERSSAVTPHNQGPAQMW